MSSVFRKVTQNGEEPYNIPPVDVGCYESYETYPYASSNSWVFLSSHDCLDSGNYPSVHSYTSYSVMNQRGVGQNNLRNTIGCSIPYRFCSQSY